MVRVFRLLALVLPLGLDTFAVAAALGLAGLSARQRLRYGLLFAAFEGGMPVLGLVLGSLLGRLIGGFADYAAAAVLIGLGFFMARAAGGDDEARVQRLMSTSGAAIIGLGISISLDELAIGFTLGLARVPVAAAVVLITIQAFVVAQLGFAVGRRAGERFRESAERLAGMVLIGLGAVLLASKFVGLPI